MKTKTMSVLWFFTGLMLMCSLLCSGAARRRSSADTLVTLVNPDLPSYKQFSDLTDIAFKKLKIPYTLTYNPAERAATSFKSGQFDGDVARTASFDKTYGSPTFTFGWDRSIRSWPTSWDAR